MPTYYVTFDPSLHPERFSTPPGKIWSEVGEPDMEVEASSPEEALEAFYAQFREEPYEPWMIDTLKQCYGLGVLTKDQAWRVEGDRLVPWPEDTEEVREWRGMWNDQYGGPEP